MKYLITAMLMMMICFAKAQIVNIPDANFKSALIAAGVDSNTDGEIQNTEAEAIISLVVNSAGTGITDFTGINAFINMRTCKITGVNAAASLDMSNMVTLEKLEANGMGFSFLAVTGCSALKELRVSRNDFAAIDISTCSNLEIALLSTNSSLQTVNIGNIAKLTMIDISNDTHFTSSLDLTRCDSLKFLFAQNSGVDTVNISGLKKITNLNAFTIQNLIARNCTGLKGINYQITIPSIITKSADLTGCINLEQVVITDLNASSLDLSTCTSLKKVALYNCGDNFQNLNIKNGSATDISDRMILSRPLNICADDLEVDTLRQIFPPGPNLLAPSVNISPDCTFYPGGNFNTIMGTVRVDANNNGCDIADSGIAHVAIKMEDALGNSFTRYTTANGNYVHYPYNGVFTVTPYLPYPYFTVSPSATTVTFDTANNLTATRNFCIQPNGIHNDLEINFLPARPAARAGFNNAYRLVYKNKGTTTLSGNVQLDFDNNKMNFISATTPAIQSPGQLIWNYNNLLPFENRAIDVIFYLLLPPVNNIGDTISYLAAITPSPNDETPLDNSFILPQKIRASYDPNEKQCLEGSTLDISKIGAYLHYVIHFQNEGTDTAFNIVVTDTLHNNLEWNSFEFVGSSHSCTPTLKNNKAAFVFENINLPYKAIDEPGSTGWVAFTIKPKPSVVIGDSLNNSAAIYFDFNLPIITNTATTIVSSSSTPVPVKLEYFAANKKENVNQLNWKASCTYGNAGFIIERSDDGIHFKAIGNINATAVRCQLPFNFTDNDPVAGKNYYRLKITDADGKRFYSKILVIGNNKAGIEITAVVNNTVYLNSDKQQTITIRVIASDGREILNQKQTIGTGNNNIHLQMKNAAKEINSLIIYTEQGETITKRFIK